MASDKPVPFISRGKLVEDIRKTIEEGYGILPLIGSGMSAASGIPAGTDYQAYLFHCLQRAFGAAPGDKMRRWDPSSLHWPSFSETPKYTDLHRAKLQWATDMLSLVKPTGASGSSDLKSEAIWLAAGAAAEWRATLHLLTRIALTNDAKNPWFRLKDPDPRVVDSFFVRLTEGRRPNSAHILLAHLADVLRIKTILTTNFDNLIELAFQRLDMPVAAFDVHYAAGLPDARLVRMCRSVVKLHGARYGLRADFSLDTKPTPDDLQRFLTYLSVFEKKRDDEPKRHQRNILVMGCSGAEHRTISYLCKALHEFKGQKDGRAFRIFWVCHTKDERARVYDAFRVQLRALTEKGEPLSRSAVKQALSRVLITASPDLGLFLLELYQTLFCCLPPAGVPFNTVWPIPPTYGQLPSNTNRSLIDDKAEELCKSVRGPESSQGSSPSEGASSHPILVYGEQYGVPLVATRAFHSLRAQFHCLWFAAEPCFDAADFANLIFRTVAFEVGRSAFFPIPADSHDNSTSEVISALTPSLDLLAEQSRRRFVLFINARDIDWNSPATRSTKTDLAYIVQWLTRAPQTKVVLLDYDKSIVSMLPRLSCRDFLVSPGTVDLPKPEESLKAFKSDLPNERTPEEQRRLARFAVGLGLFRYPTYLSALQCWALQEGPDKDEDGSENKDRRRFVRAGEMLKSLRTHFLVRDDEGQNAYVYPRLRAELTEQLSAHCTITPLEIAEINQGIADWYVKLYRSSGDLHAAVQSIEHRLECIKRAHANGSDQSMQRGHLLLSAASEIALMLKTIRPAVSSSVRLGSLLSTFGRFRKGLSATRQLLCQEVGHSRDACPLCRTVDVLAHCHDDLLELEQQYTSQVGRALTTDSPLFVEPRTLPRLDATTQEENLLVQKMNARCYNEAEDRANSLLERLRIQSIEASARSQAREWVLDARFKPDMLPIAVRVVRRFQQLRLYQAELQRLLGCNGDESRGLLRHGEQLYSFATELLRYATGLRFVHTEMGRLRSNMGITLSLLGRHGDAHRQYSEAYGYIDSLPGPGADLRFATIDLRRVETFLCQLVSRPNGDGSENWFGIAYDAYSGVERALYKVGAIAATPRWYAWLRQVEMQVYHEIARLKDVQRFPKFRDGPTLGSCFARSMREGLIVAGKDPLRLACYLDLAKRFLVDDDDHELIDEHDRSQIKGQSTQAASELNKVLMDWGTFEVGELDPSIREFAAAQLKAARQ